MKSGRFLAFAVSFLAAAAVVAQGFGDMKPKTVPKAKVSGPVFLPAADLKWVDLDPSGKFPGVVIADAWGDHTTGAYGAFIKFPAGFTTPLHTHTNATKLVIISGTFIQTPEGKPAVRLGPGSYLMQPGGSYRHVTACDKASECLFFAQSSAKFDLVPATAAKAPASK